MTGKRLRVERLVVRGCLLLGLTGMPAAALAETAAAPPMAAQETNVALRERVAKLEEQLEAQRRETEKVQAEVGKMKEKSDELVMFKETTLVYLSGAIALFGVVAWFFYGRLKERIEKDGGPKVVVDAVIESLYANDAAKFTRLFEQHRNELTRVIMSRDQPIAFVGDHEDSDLIKRALKDIGYERFVGDPKAAKLALVFCQSETFGDLVTKLLEDLKQNRLPRRLVLYSAGGKMLDPAKVRELNTWAMAIAANMPTTAATQLATLAALAQPII